MRFPPPPGKEPPTQEEVTACYLVLIPTLCQRVQLQAFWHLTSFLPRGPQKACIRAALLARVKALGFPLKPVKRSLLSSPGTPPFSEKAPDPEEGGEGGA